MPLNITIGYGTTKPAGRYSYGRALWFHSGGIVWPFFVCFYQTGSMDRLKRNQIIDSVNNLISGENYQCIEVEWVEKDAILRLYVDHPDGMPMERCVAATKVMGEAEDLDALIEGAYTLEVSSPGIERPLRTAQDFGAAAGKTAKVWLLEEAGGQKAGTGMILSCDADVITLETKRGEWAFPLNVLDRAHIKFDW